VAGGRDTGTPSGRGRARVVRGTATTERRRPLVPVSVQAPPKDRGLGGPERPQPARWTQGQTGARRAGRRGAGRAVAATMRPAVPVTPVRPLVGDLLCPLRGHSLLRRHLCSSLCDPAYGIGPCDPAYGIGPCDPAYGIGPCDPAYGIGSGDLVAEVDLVDPTGPFEPMGYALLAISSTSRSASRWAWARSSATRTGSRMTSPVTGSRGSGGRPRRRFWASTRPFHTS